MKTIQIILLTLWTMCIVLFSGCKEPPVTKPEVKVTGVTLNKKDLALVPGEMVQLIATVEPEDANNKQVTWRSDNPSVAIVDENGLVTAIKDGRTDVGVFTQDGDYRDLCCVKVDHRANWAGSYECEKSWYSGEHTETVIVDVTVKEEFYLYYLTERNSESNNLGIDVRVNIDGSFKKITEERPYISGQLHTDSIYIYYLAYSPQFSLWIEYWGKRIEVEGQ